MWDFYLVWSISYCLSAFSLGDYCCVSQNFSFHVWKVGFKKPCAYGWGKGRLMLYTYICRYYCLVTGIFLLRECKKPLLFQTKSSNCHSKEISKSWFLKVQMSLRFYLFTKFPHVPQALLHQYLVCLVSSGLNTKDFPTAGSWQSWDEVCKSWEQKSQVCKEPRAWLQSCGFSTCHFPSLHQAGRFPSCLLSRQFYSIFAKISSHKTLKFW